MNEPWMEEAAYTARREAEMERYPVCENCGHHIVEDKAYTSPITGKTICDSCMDTEIDELLDLVGWMVEEGREGYKAIKAIDIEDLMAV